MTKKFTLLYLAIMLISAGLFAQHKTLPTQNERQIPYMARVSHIHGPETKKAIALQGQNGLMKTNATTTLKALPKTVVYYDWSANRGRWDNFPDTTLNTYNAEGKLLSVVSINVDTLSITKSRIINTYNTNGSLNKYVSLDWNTSTKIWDSGSKYIYMYDAFGNQTEYQYFAYNNNVADHISGDKQTFTYNSKNQITGAIFQGWDAGRAKYIDRSKGIYTLDSSGKITVAEVMDWDSMAFGYIKSVKQSNFVWTQWNGNIDNSIPSSYLSQRWNGIIYQDDYRTADTYDSKGNYTSSKYESWDTIATKWLIYSWSQTELTYDLQDAITESKGTQFDTVSGKWKISDWNKYTLTYNGTDLTQSIRQDWDTTSARFGNTYKEVYSDFDYVSGISLNKSEAMQLSVYPNPVIHTLNIKLVSTDNSFKNDELKIYSLSGQVVHQQRLNANLESVHINLPSGLYIYTVMGSNNIIANGKIIVK